jgi:hypothetical protein
MNLQDFASIAEIVGGFAVLATLVYLSIQIKSNTRQLRFTASQGIAESLDRAYDPIYSEHIAPIWLKGNADLESISAAERVIFDGLMGRLIHNVANMLDARESGLIPNVRTDKLYNKFYKDAFSTPGSKQWISGNPELGEMVHEYVKAIDN